VIAAVSAATVSIIVIIAVVLMSLGGGKNPESGHGGMTHAYDSPVGLVPGMQARQVQSGKFKLRAGYVTGGDFTRQGTFAVEDGHVYFDMVADDVRLNQLLKFLYDRQANKVPFAAEKHGVDRSQSYDFASVLGYHYLYDQNGGELSGFVPQVEAVKATPPAKPDTRYTLTSDCDTALADVKKLTDMSSTDLAFETKQEGANKMRATVRFSTLQAVDKSVVAFFDKCFDLAQPANAGLKKFVDVRREDVTKSPSFTFWEENGVHYLDVSAPAKDTPFGSELHFELSDLSTSPTQHTGTTGSYVERRNQFGLAYSLCRVDPVITTSFAAGYRFLYEDPDYAYPAISDSGYYCTTLAVPPQFRPASTITLKPNKGAARAVSGKPIDGLRGLHDLTFEVEQYNIANKRYPGPTEFRDLANSNMGALSSVTQTAFADKSLVYAPTPTGCVGTCKDYALTFVPTTGIQVKRTTYHP